jgi:hypothetical protein
VAEPDLCAFFEELGSGYGWDWGALSVDASAIGLVTGSNPPYTASDFFTFFPQFAGAPTQLLVTLTGGSTQALVTNTAGLAPGQLIVGNGIPGGTTIVSTSSGVLTLSQAATLSGNVQASVYTSPYVPLAVVNAYINLASASLAQARWLDAWQIAMGWFVAHFATLYLRCQGDACSTPGQVAAAGLNVGITVSKSAGPVSQGLQLVGGLDGWASWNQTQYGVQFATMAKVVGSGPVYVY